MSAKPARCGAVGMVHAGGVVKKSSAAGLRVEVTGSREVSYLDAGPQHLGPLCHRPSHYRDDVASRRVSFADVLLRLTREFSEAVGRVSEVSGQWSVVRCGGAA